MPHDEAQYCAEQVRRFDRDRWLSTLLAPDAAQRDLLVLYAFNLELARIREDGFDLALLGFDQAALDALAAASANAASSSGQRRGRLRGRASAAIAAAAMPRSPRWRCADMTRRPVLYGPGQCLKVRHGHVARGILVVVIV